MTRQKSLFLSVTAAGLLLLTTACTAQLDRSIMMAESMAESRSPNRGVPRLIVRSGDLAISVAEPEATQTQVETILQAESGLIVRSTADESSIWIESRVPAERLDSVIAQIARLGKVLRRSISAEDVTDQHADLNSRLETSRQLRDRMRELLERAQDVKDLLAIETELARVQSEIEAMENQLNRLDSQIQLSDLSLRLEQKRVLGPLGFVGYWTGWAFSKLFVLQ